MEQKKLMLADIPYYKNLEVFDNVYGNMIDSGLWFDNEDDSPAENINENVYTYDKEEYQWCIDFASAYEWVQDHEEDIKQAFKKELASYHGEVNVSELFDEVNDYVDRIGTIKRRVRQYLSTQ